MNPRKLLCAATLACLAPFGALSAEIHLTPSKNGDSGVMPSGYDRTLFEVSAGDFIDEVKLPANPRPGDAVLLSSTAWGSPRLDASGTSVADLVYIPVEPLSFFDIRHSGVMGRWIATGAGDSEARVLVQGDGHVRSPMIDRAFVDLHVAGGVSTLQLPAWAPRGAVLGVVNYTGGDFTITGPELAGADSICEKAKSCAFVFDGSDGRWHARRGRAHFQPTTSQLPMPAQRWTDIVTGNPATDVTTPPRMLLPVEGIEGDIIQFTDPSNSGAYRVENAVLTDVPRTYRYDSQQRRWVYQPRR
ncbi:hypothetical protein [Stenotrophomonas sp. RAC2]|uniref:hypothetical protein n=1 Tax=Stenotrophomonas sp. RAC2 TaxID=3064902 RepID=UPI00271FDE8A|nr:hypothetical protein [Stenotrophomonas sp. RAC2]MDV9043861.1 hypothetical protein [Stenotrophomonas sp. RAC2]